MSYYLFNQLLLLIIYNQFFRMEAQDLYQVEISKIFALHNPHPKTYLNLATFLNQQCRTIVENTRRFLDVLSNIHPILINFHAFCKIIRIIRKTVLTHKSQLLQHLFSDIIIKHAALYFPYLANLHTKQFEQLLELFDGLSLQQPQNLKDHRKVLIYLSKAKYSQEFTHRVIQLINNEALVDKKNQEYKSIKINQFFSAFVVKHFQEFIPQLQRLLVRSESNLQVWQEFFKNVKIWKGIDSFVLILLNKIKTFYTTQPDTCVSIVISLISHLNDEKTLKQVISYLSGLIGGEHNVKRKIVYVQMLEGLIASLKKVSDQNLKSIFAQQLLVLLGNSLIKFTQEQQFKVLIKILDQLLPLVKQPKDDVAKTLKIYLKNQNKYILIIVGTILSTIYKKQHIDSLPSAKEIFTHYKSQLPTALKKIESNWQWLMPIISYLSEYDLSIIENLSQDFPLFKVSCLALTKPEMKTGLRLIHKKIKHLQNQEQEISNDIFVSATLLLEQIKQTDIWRQFINNLSISEKLSLLTKGIFPLLIFTCSGFSKNKGNQFQSLLLFMRKILKKQELSVQNGLDLAKILFCFRKIKNEFSSLLHSEKLEDFNGIIQQYVNSSLYEVEHDQENVITEKQSKIIDKISNSLLTYKQNYLIGLFEPFTKQEFYKKDLQFLNNFNEKLLESVKNVKNQLNSFKELLVEKQIHKVEEVKPKKVYIGVNFQIKMMSEQEVKQQKYRKHFLKMAELFDKITASFLLSLTNHDLLNQLWHKNLKSLLLITKYPEHRLSIYKLVKRSCLFTAWHNKKSQQSKIFVKYSQFMAQFFSFKNSGITPSVKIMNHCQVFLKQLLSLPFEQQNHQFPMLQNVKEQFIMMFVNEMCETLLQNMEFDLNLKKLAIKFYYKCNKKQISFSNEEILFTYIAQNINILSNCENIQSVLSHLLIRVDQSRFKDLFAEILNFIQPTKKLILHTITLLPTKYKPQFQEFIKLKILALESNQEISKLAIQILNYDAQNNVSILTFNMKNFVQKNSKETIQKLCLFIKQEITAETAQSVFKMVLKASEQLFDEGFDQEGLQMLPFFLTINVQYINEQLFKPVFEILITKYTSKAEFGTLTKLSVEIGIDIIKRNAKNHAEKLLLVLQSFINKSSGVSNIIFLGVLAPYLEGNQNMQIIQKRITQLFKSEKEADQRAIAKCIPDLMSFFKKPLQIIESIFTNIGSMTEQLQVGQSYLFSGLLKGIGYKQTLQYLDRILLNTYITKTKPEKLGKLYLLHALIQNFGRVVEVKSIKIIEIILGYMADSAEDIRNLARKAGQNLILRMSSFSVKILLPQLLKGLQQEQNWRVKISYIWILGIMANSSAKQLQTSLPIIVPSLSSCLSNAHPIIREKASEALNLIGQTIKNPQISQCVDILIEALENPFEMSQKAIQVLLKTSFSHYIDPPSLSMIIPILDYCMRGRVSDLKAGACQVMGSIVELILNAYDLLPYLKIIITGMKTALCDPLLQIRRIASMAIGKISTKIGIKSAELYFKFVVQIIESPLSNTTERQGAAQAYAEIICSQSFEYFQESLYKIFDKLNSIRHSQKEGYILVFLYVPLIRTQQFEGFIKQVNENMYCFVSDEQQNIRNSAMMVQKVLISNYCLSHTDLLLQPLCDGIFESNWKKRNAAIILIGQLLNIIKSHMYNTRTTDKNYAYYQGLMAVYIIKDDDLEMTRLTANQVWNTYIENTPKTIKLGLQELVRMWTKWTHAAGGVVFKNIVAFSSKYGQNYFTQILEYLPQYLKQPEHQVGVFEVLAEFIKRLNQQFLSKPSYREGVKKIFTDHLFIISENVRPSLAKSLALYVDKMHQQAFFQDLLCPTIQKMDHTDESNPQYTYNLHLLKDLLNTNSVKVTDRVISKIMESPMSQFKIQVITNNSERLANYLYSHFKKPATQLLVEEIYTLVQDKTKDNRLNLIIYCLEQVSLQLNKKNKAQFIKMVTQNIRKGINLYNQDHINSKVLEIFNNMLLYFLNSTPLSQIQDLDIIIGEISPLVFLGDQKIANLGHKIYLLVITDSKSPRTSEFIRQMIVSFENKITKQDQIIWDNEEILRDYISILVKGIAYGREQVMEQSLDMIEFLLKRTPRALIEAQILKIVGPIIRISNYPLFLKQKIRIMELLISILRQSYKIDAFNNQILSVCLRLLQQFKNSTQIIEIVADTYFALLTSTVLKQELILTLLAKVKTHGANLIHSFYYLVKKIIKEQIELPKTVFQKIFDEATILLLNNQGKLSVKGTYYISKIAGRLGVVLGKPIEKIQSQLKGLALPYEIMLNYLHFIYYKKSRINRMQSIQIFIKESNRQKVYYLLKSVKLCIKNSEESKKLYSLQYIKALVPQTLIGFDDISEIMQEFQSEITEEQQQIEGQINET